MRASLSLLSDGQWYMNHDDSYNGVQAYISVWSYGWEVMGHGVDGVQAYISVWSYGWEVMGRGVDGVQASDFQGASGLHIPWPVNQGKSCISQYMALKDALIASVGACTPDG